MVCLEKVRLGESRPDLSLQAGPIKWPALCEQRGKSCGFSRLPLQEASESISKHFKAQKTAGNAPLLSSGDVADGVSEQGLRTFFDASGFMAEDPCKRHALQEHEAVPGAKRQLLREIWQVEPSAAHEDRSGGMREAPGRSL